MYRQILHNHRGITLLEVLVALIIMSLSLLVLLNLAMVALEGNDWSDKTTKAVHLLQQKLESLRVSGAYEDGCDTVGAAVRSWTVTDAGDYLRQIDIAVSWPDANATTRTTTMSTIVRTDSL